MKRAMMLILLLTLVSCGAPLRGGKIVGKHTKIYRGIMEDTTQYYLQLEKNEQTGTVEVTKAAWNQAHTGLTWPFEVEEK